MNVKNLSFEYIFSDIKMTIVINLDITVQTLVQILFREAYPNSTTSKASILWAAQS